MFDWNILIGSILDNIAVPIIIAIGGAVLVVVKHYADKVAKSVIAKNEISAMEKQGSVRKSLLETLGTIVEAAVASNMQLADTMKRDGTKLTQDQIVELNLSATQLIYNSLPPSLTNEDGVLLEIIGGTDKLNAVIKSMMEKYVYEYKLRPKNTSTTTSTSQSQNPSVFNNRRL